ncbi:hypothetical protein LCGC14_1380290 [marine sediment metagenome]|uniref:Uncharacterized protein n=1 Tax=marine sediment metagenome TaxID=412755 RepID=A0A0F9K2Z0_9ZZZZ
MKQTVNFSQFCDAFRGMNRDNNFSYDGKRALFDYIEEYEEGTGEDTELDIIALCCEFTEYENLAELQENYSDIESTEELNDHTTVIMIDNERFIIQDY